MKFLVLSIVLCGCSALSNFNGYHFAGQADGATDAGEDLTCTTCGHDASSSATDAGELEQRDASRLAPDSGSLEPADASQPATDAGELEQRDASPTDLDAGGKDAGVSDCGVLDPSCHGCAAPSHWCPFQRLCGLPSQC